MCKAFLVDDKRSKKETELQNAETLDGNGGFFVLNFPVDRNILIK